MEGMEQTGGGEEEAGGTEQAEMSWTVPLPTGASRESGLGL